MVVKQTTTQSVTLQSLPRPNLFDRVFLDFTVHEWLERAAPVLLPATLLILLPTQPEPPGRTTQGQCTPEACRHYSCATPGLCWLEGIDASLSSCSRPVAPPLGWIVLCLGVPAVPLFGTRRHVGDGPDRLTRPPEPRWPG
jgi:hypothetical protein